ncbi:MAPEG family protein [Sphingosinicella microcystinivorans]|uniref:MAPEG family protein n=1 Tax=Sphingosinicella microcystinivorans TaxID=335406 RepID=UPI0022F38B51|nr:MAPEG family protein [Sphingosinicella microcystinivorans]WBX82671.1 MAPEG family protein [Sphingosinicella microcystinivorans]
MPIELYLLGTAAVLGLVHILWAVNVKTAQYGTQWNMGARDAEMPPLKPLAGRLARAQANFFETFPLFAAVLLGALAADRLGWKTELGAHLYLWARLIYLPLYAAGIPKVRTLVWLVSLAGLVLVLWALLLG